MADGSTTNYGFVLPEVGSSADTWGAKLNANFTSIDDVTYTNFFNLNNAVLNRLPLTGGAITGSLSISTTLTVGNGIAVSAGNSTFNGNIFAEGIIDAPVFQVLPSFALYTSGADRFRQFAYDSNDYYVYDSLLNVLKFYIGGVLAYQVDQQGPAVSSFQSLITTEKGDARYLLKSPTQVVIDSDVVTILSDTRAVHDYNVPNAPAGRRRWRVGAGTDRFTIDCASDDFSSFQSAIVIDRAVASVYNQQVRVNYEGAIALAVDPAGTGVVSNKTAITVEKGDARYQLSVSRRDMKTKLVEEAPPSRIWDIPVFSYKWNKDVMRNDDRFKDRKGYGLMADDVQQVWDVASDGETLDLRCLIGALWHEVSRLRKKVKQLEDAAGGA